MTTKQRAAVIPTAAKNDESTDREKLIQAVVKEVFSTLNMRLKSILTTKQMVQMVRLEAYAEHFNSPLAKYVHQAILESTVSTDAKGGRGRGDLVETLKAIVSQDSPTVDKNKSLMQKLLQRG